MPADLPALRVDDVERLLAMTAHVDVTIARAARDGGTNALRVSPPDAIEFCFGVDSARRHAEAATAAGLTARIVDDPAFRSDIDVPEDLREFCNRAPDCDSLRALIRIRLDANSRIATRCCDVGRDDPSTR